LSWSCAGLGSAGGRCRGRGRTGPGGLAAPLSRCARRWPLALVAFLLALVAQAVVEPTEQPAVVLGGEPPCGIGLHVVDLAALGGLVAVGWVQMRSRSSMALRVPPVKNRDRTLTSMRLPRLKMARSK